MAEKASPQWRPGVCGIASEVVNLNRGEMSQMSKHKHDHHLFEPIPDTADEVLQRFQDTLTPMPFDQIGGFEDPACWSPGAMPPVDRRWDGLYEEYLRQGG
jgi:hypothetical protein